MALKRKRTGPNIFDLLRYLTHNKRPWDKLTDEEKKMGSFMINKWLSMDPDLLPVVNHLQKYTVSGMAPEYVYKLYYGLLPNVKFYFKYVKGKTTDKYNPELKALIAKHLETSKTEAEDCIDVIKSLPNYKDTLKEFLLSYGKNDKEIKTMLK